MLATAFTRLAGCRVPVQLAPMPGVATTALAAAVSNAGGLGMIGAPMTPLPLLARMLDDLDARTKAPYGVNFLIPFLDPECLALAELAAEQGDPARAMQYYERAIAQMNSAVAPEIETVFLVSAPEHSAINSTIVRDIVRHGGDASQYLQQCDVHHGASLSICASRGSWCWLSNHQLAARILFVRPFCNSKLLP